MLGHRHLQLPYTLVYSDVVVEALNVDASDAELHVELHASRRFHLDLERHAERSPLFEAVDLERYLVPEGGRHEIDIFGQITAFEFPKIAFDLHLDLDAIAGRALDLERAQRDIQAQLVETAGVEIAVEAADFASGNARGETQDDSGARSDAS